MIDDGLDFAPRSLAITPCPSRMVRRVKRAIHSQILKVALGTAGAVAIGVVLALSLIGD